MNRRWFLWRGFASMVAMSLAPYFALPANLKSTYTTRVLHRGVDLTQSEEILRALIGKAGEFQPSIVPTPPSSKRTYALNLDWPERPLPPRISVAPLGTLPVAVESKWVVHESGRSVEDLEWRILRPSGYVAGGGQPPLLQGADALGTLEVTLDAVVTELGAAGPPPVHRQIIAAIRLAASSVTTDWIQFKPGEVTLPVIRVPTLLMLFRHRPYGGEALAVVPVISPIVHGANLQNSLTNALDNLRDEIVSADMLSRYAFFMQQLNPRGGTKGIKDRIADATRITFVKAESISNLDDIVIHDYDFLWDFKRDMTAEDRMSSLFLIGRDKRKAKCFVRRAFQNGEGQLDIEVGAELLVMVGNLDSKHPKVTEERGSAHVVEERPPWTVWPGRIVVERTFDNCISSIAFA